MAMIHGLPIRVLCFFCGVIPLAAIPHLLDVSLELRETLELLYLVVGGSYLARYCIRHQDEIPTRSGRD